MQHIMGTPLGGYTISRHAYFKKALFSDNTYLLILFLYLQPFCNKAFKLPMLKKTSHKNSTQSALSGMPLGATGPCYTFLESSFNQQHMPPSCIF